MDYAEIELRVVAAMTAEEIARYTREPGVEIGRYVEDILGTDPDATFLDRLIA